MSVDTAFTKESLKACLSALGKEFRKLNGTKMSAEIVLIGGASVLANYGFRDATYDIDAVIYASSVMKEAVNRVGDELGLPNGWINMDFTATGSYTKKLVEVSVYYRTFSNILTVRSVAAEYLIAMKLMSGRQYKYDLSDIVGIVWEHQQRGEPITKEAVIRAVEKLYGGWAELPPSSQEFMQKVFGSEDYEAIYADVRMYEQVARKTLLESKDERLNSLAEESSTVIIEQAKLKGKG